VCGDANRYLAISRSCRRGIRAAGQLHRNLDGQGSAGEQHLGARGGPARVPLRNTGLFRVADQVMPEGQPFAGLSQNARFDKLCGSALPAPERTTSWQRRAGDREPPPRPMGGDPLGRTGIPRKPGGVCSPPTRSSSTTWPGRTRPRRCPLPRGHGRTRRAGTGCCEPARLCAACADFNVLT